MPTVGFWDTGEFQTVGPVLGTAHPTGFPSFVVLSWLASIVLTPFGEPALRINLLSALLSAGAVAAFIVLARQLSGYILVALALAAALALDPVFLRLANHADAHVFHLFLTALIFGLLVIWEARRRTGASADRWLLAAAIVYGVAVANHTLALLLAPAIAVYVLAVEPRIVLRPKVFFGALALAIGVAALFYLELPIRAAMGAPLVYGRPDTWDGFKYVVLAEQFTNGIISPFADLGGKFAAVSSALSAQLGLLLWLAPVGFAATLWRAPRYALASGIAVVLTCWFAASYTNADLARYYLGPTLFILSWLAVLAGSIVRAFDDMTAPSRPPSKAAAPDQPANAEITSDPGLSGFRRLARNLSALDLAVALVIGAILVNAVPANLSVAGVDESHDTWARDQTAQELALMAPDAVVVSWWSYSTPLWYDQLVLGQRKDISIIDDRTRLDQNLGSLRDVIETNLGKRPIYLIRHDDELADLRTSYVLTPLPNASAPIMWRVDGRVSP
jgi:hypothetical protein